MKRILIHAALWFLIPLSAWTIRAGNALGILTMRLWTEVKP
ncbi:hypothetical protein H845_150 [Komagataeibacter xylinus E25]|nr:hypothetical protein [Novacetimonas hansenii]AHI24115.1 hypothetical protein H845_150 [Komagataeibacter xylinus E25]